MKRFFDIPVYYISFLKNVTLEKRLKELGFSSVTHFQAIDGRKFNIDDLLMKGLIGQTVYYDLKCGRVDDIGIPSLGAVGCTMSHAALWKVCVDKGLPEIIILEEDVEFKHGITTSNVQEIEAALSFKNSVWVSAVVQKQPHFCGDELFGGLQFYVASNGACKELVKRVWPMQLQTDVYMSLLGNMGLIHITANNTLATQSMHSSTIQSAIFQGLFNRQNDCFIITFSVSVAIIIILLIAVVLLAVKNNKHQK